MMRGAALGNISRPPARAPLLVDLFLIRAVSVSAAQFFSLQSSVLSLQFFRGEMKEAAEPVAGVGSVDVCPGLGWTPSLN